MIKVEIPQDPTKYKEHLFFGFTTRQLLSIVGIIAVAVICFALLSRFIDSTVLMYLLVLFVAPLAAFGFLEYNGMPAEKVAATVINFYISKQRRKMRYTSAEQEIHEEVRKIALEGAVRERAKELKEEKSRKKKKPVKVREKKGKKNAAAVN